MEDNKDFKTPPKTRQTMGGPRGMGMAPEKAKDFKGSISKLMSYIGRYKIGNICGNGYLLQLQQYLM